jgi:diguanylate cyclase (GGDEF)-like protein
VARLGGDEFVVVAGGLPHSPVAEVVGDRIRRELEGLTATDGRHVGVSVGVAVSPDDGLGIYDLLRAADRRMYTVKRSRV